MELDSLIKKLEQEKAAIDQRIKIEMQDATIAVEADYKISWSNIEQSRFDAKKFKEDDPVMYNKLVSEKVVVFTGYVRLLVFDLSEHIYVMIVMCSERYTF